jgi:hypothetical protein
MAPAKSMVTVSEARTRVRSKVEQLQREWAALGGSEAVVDIVLHPPTERAALADQATAIAWVSGWRALDESNARAHVHWGARAWPSLGTQSVPERLILRGADAIAEFAGQSSARAWRTLGDRAAKLHSLAVDDAAAPGAMAGAIRGNARQLGELSDGDFATLLDIVEWLRLNPASGWRIRQLPIRGVDTKWLERRRVLVESLHTATSGRSSLGLIGAPDTVRLRFLDPALRPGGLIDVTVPVNELARLEIAPQVIFVFENLETMFSMPDMTGAVVLHGAGYGLGRLQHIPWVADGRIVYWGDLDSDGFSILHGLRSHCDDVTSVLMDEATLLEYRDLWVPETRPAKGSYANLTDAEQLALARIRLEGNVRLEQERIPWTVALQALTEFVM